MKTKRYITLKQLLNNAFTYGKAFHNDQPLNLIATDKDPHKFKLMVEGNNIIFYTIRNYTYNETTKITKNFYEKFNKNKTP